MIARRIPRPCSCRPAPPSAPQAGGDNRPDPKFPPPNPNFGLAVPLLPAMLNFALFSRLYLP